MRRIVVAIAGCLLAACGTVGGPGAPTRDTAPPAGCEAYAPPPFGVGAEIEHVKTSVTVIEVTSPCTVRVRVSRLLAGDLSGQVVVLRATSRTTFASASQGDLAAIGRFGLRAGDAFTLSLDSRAFPDGSYPLNFMNR